MQNLNRLLTQWTVRLLWLAVIIVIALLVFNPGYFSHDEISWGYYARDARWANLPWPDWFNINSFQYRPLTFTVWVGLSRLLFDTPMVFHATMVTLGISVCWLLSRLLKDLGVDPTIATRAAALFLVSPYVVYVHGWVGTLADLIWVACAISASRLLLLTPTALNIIGVTILTSLALLAKEAAITIPALLGALWWYCGRQPNRIPILLASLIPVMIYLLLRWSVLMSGGENPDIYGGLSLLSAPQHWFHYLIFPAHLKVLEVHVVGHQLSGAHWQEAAAAAGFTLLAGALALRRLPGAWSMLPVSAVALGPVLLLPGSANQYGYGLSAVLTIYFALGWQQGDRLARTACLALMMVYALHGVTIAAAMNTVGRLGDEFISDVARLLETDPERSLRLRVDCDDYQWVFSRFAADLPGFDQVVIGNQLRLVNDGQPANGSVACNGSVTIKE